MNDKNYPKLYSIKFREIELSDAEYVLKLRTNDSYSKYISKVSDDIYIQRNYIKNYIKENQSNRNSFYFIIENEQSGMRCGTVRIYNFDRSVFEWGSWILDENKPRYAAMETAIMIYEFAFKVLCFEKSEFEVNKENDKVVSYHLKSGANIIREDNINFYFRIEKEIALKFANDLRNKIESKIK